MNRRETLTLAAAALAAPLLPRPLHAQAAGGPEALIEAARALAAQPYQPAPGRLVAPFDALTYDSFRGIRSRPGETAAIDLGAGFRADLLPPGWLFPDPVQIALPGRPDPIPFDPTRFDLDPRYFAPGLRAQDYAGMGFSGLRLRYPLNVEGRDDDLLVLQGASYFRALARDVAYGLSARGLALGTGGPEPEEFPVTRRIAVFGVEGGALHLGCLIDSPRASAALIVRLLPGRAGAPETVMDCALHLIPRVALADAGIAPLTSMFQHSDLGPAAIDDFRPAVHDSDVLVIDNGAGERLWRPLANPARLQMSAFQDTGPRGFGLLQSATDFARFRDAEADYHRRPSAMVVPQGDWGAGAVMLLEIPTPDEYADNIVAFWRPAEVLEAGRLYRYDYRLIWAPPGPGALPQGAQAFPLLAKRNASGIEPSQRRGRLFVIDFVPAPGVGGQPEAAALTLDIAPLEGVEISGQVVYPLVHEPGTLRASFVLTPEAGTEAAELRLRLRHRDSGALAAPVWLFRWTRARDGGP